LRTGEDAQSTLNSLRRVLALYPRLLACSHAGLIKDACGAIERRIAYWEILAEQARALRQEGLSLREVTDRLLGPEDMMFYLTWGQFSKLNLIRLLLEEKS
jgi:hypothetical protein